MKEWNVKRVDIGFFFPSPFTFLPLFLSGGTDLRDMRWGELVWTRLYSHSNPLSAEKELRPWHWPMFSLTTVILGACMCVCAWLYFSPLEPRTLCSPWSTICNCPELWVLWYSLTMTIKFLFLSYIVPIFFRDLCWSFCLLPFPSTYRSSFCQEIKHCVKFKERFILPCLLCEGDLTYTKTTVRFIICIPPTF